MEQAPAKDKWDRAVALNRAAMGVVVSALFGLFVAHSASGPDAMRLPRGVWCALLAMLRQAEAALQRLIVMAKGAWS